MDLVRKLRILVVIVVLPVSYFAFRCIPRDSGIESEPAYVGKKLCAVAGENIVLLDTMRNVFDISNFTAAVHVLVFYSGNCDQCQSKQKALRKLTQKYMKEPVRVVYIRTGKESFGDFVGHPIKKQTRLFDEEGRLTDALDITTFPTEVIIDDRGFIKHVSTGYSAASEKEYMQLTGIKIDSLLVSARSGQ